MKLDLIETKLREQNLSLFTSQEFRRAVGLTNASAKFILVRYVKKGLILKVKARRGLYCLCWNLPHPWLIANRRPSW